MNNILARRPRLLNTIGAELTIVDAYGAPGDTLLTAIVGRNVRQRFPEIRLNCITAYPELLVNDPNWVSLNRPETFFSVWSWYPETVGRRDGQVNILKETFDRLGWGANEYEYRAEVYLTKEELTAASHRVAAAHGRPIITFNTRSKEEVKDWSNDSWCSLLRQLQSQFYLVQLGDGAEPSFPGVRRFAGTLSLRESMSVLSHAHVHVGGVSFLTHAANGLGVPSVVIFGGRETPMNSGYAGNINLYADVPCAPCWLHSSLGERCVNAMQCMQQISVARVAAAIDELMRRNADGNRRTEPRPGI